ncbi:MAG TPA: carboxypeptidase-like regulatory domain-containing protein [Terriglobales bacterium]
MKRHAVLVVAVALLATSVFADKHKKPEDPTSTINFVVIKDDNGKPVRNAGVVLHLVNDKDKQERGGLELKSDPDGKCSIDGIPYGKVRVQVIASGFQTYGEDYDVTGATMDITIKLKRPGQMYSVYDQPTGSDQKPDQTQKPAAPPR